MTIAMMENSQCRVDMTPIPLQASNESRTGRMAHPTPMKPCVKPGNWASLVPLGGHRSHFLESVGQETGARIMSGGGSGSSLITIAPEAVTAMNSAGGASSTTA